MERNEAMETEGMFALINRNHFEAEARKCARNAERRVKCAEIRQERRVNWMVKAMRCTTVACVGIGCGAAALGGLYPVLMAPLSIVCGMYAAGIFGSMACGKRVG